MITLETTDVFRIQLEFPDYCLPTCSSCGHKMDKLTIMTDCIYSVAANKGSWDSRLEGQTTHVHFQHEHPNSDTLKTQYYCPTYNKRW